MRGTGLVDAVVTVTDGDGDEDTDRLDIGERVKFEDDGPVLGDPEPDDTSPTGRDPLVALTAGAMFTSVDFTWDPGEDEEGSNLFIVEDSWTDPASLPQAWLDAFDSTGTGDPFTAELSGDGKVLTYKDADGEAVFTVTLTDNGNGTASWEVEINQDAPVGLNDVPLVDNTDPGAPRETVPLNAEGGNVVTIDGLLSPETRVSK